MLPTIATQGRPDLIGYHGSYSTQTKKSGRSGGKKNNFVNQHSNTHAIERYLKDDNSWERFTVEGEKASGQATAGLASTRMRSLGQIDRDNNHPPAQDSRPPALKRYLKDDNSWERFTVKGKETAGHANASAHQTLAEMSKGMGDHQSM